MEHHHQGDSEETRHDDSLDLLILEDLSLLKRAQLQSLCKKHGVKASGKSIELIQRLDQVKANLLGRDGDHSHEEYHKEEESQSLLVDHEQSTQESPSPESSEHPVLGSESEEEPLTHQITISYTSAIAAPAAEPNHTCEDNTNSSDDIKPWGSTPLPSLENTSSQLAYPIANESSIATTVTNDTSVSKSSSSSELSSKALGKTKPSSNKINELKKSSGTKLPVPRMQQPSKSAKSTVPRSSQTKPAPSSTTSTSSLKQTVSSRPTSASTLSDMKSTSIMKATPKPAVKKPAFDLKASLQKPLSWKPYTGAVKPLTEPISAMSQKKTYTA